MATATSKPSGKTRLPNRFADLVTHLPPRAIQDETQLVATTAMIDRLMTAGELSTDQASYLETLVQLVEAHDAEHHAIDASDVSGIDSLRHLMAEHGMNASDLARLLGIHVSMGSKILKGERALTVGHMKALATHFGVRPGLFID